MKVATTMLFGAMALCGLAKANMSPTSYTLGQLSLTAVNGHVEQTDSFTVNSPALAVLVLNTATPYNEAPACNAPCTSFSDVSIFIPGIISDFSGDSRTPLGPSSVEDYQPMIYSSKQATIDPGTYLLNLSISLSGDSNSLPATDSIVVDLQVLSGSVSVGGPVPATVPEPGTLALAGITSAGAIMLRRNRKLPVSGAHPGA